MMTSPAEKPLSGGTAAALRFPVFRRIWMASLLSNLGLLVQGVGSAWAMIQMTATADKVALVQTALMLPIMIIAMPAGAIADMYDRRVVTLIALSIALSGATALAVMSWFGLITPQILLALCFVVGCGNALFGPAWQSSVSEQVPSEALPSAIALNGISYNIARSFGPAIGGVIVALAGAGAAFGANALLYLPLIIVFLLWRRATEPSRLPPERLSRAIVSGVRYITNSPSIRVLLTRTLSAYSPNDNLVGVTEEAFQRGVAQARAAGFVIFDTAIQTTWGRPRSRPAEPAYRALVEGVREGLTFFCLHFNAPGELELIEPRSAYIRTEEYELFRDQAFRDWLAEQPLDIIGMRPLREELRATLGGPARSRGEPAAEQQSASAKARKAAARSAT